MNSSDFLKIHDLALAEVLQPSSSEYYYRQVCRWYSEKFHTPLHEVHTLQPHFVLQNYYEATLSMLEEEDLEKIIFRALNPDVDEDSEEEIQDFIDMIEQEIATNKKPKQKMSAKPSKKQSLAKTPASGTSDESMVIRTYDEVPPPEAGLEDSTSSEPSTPTLGDEE